MPRLAISVALLFTLSVPAFAQEPELKPTKLTLKAAKAPVPALKYRLLPEVRDLEPGNAMMCYMRAFAPDMGRKPAGKQWNMMIEQLEMPLEEFKKAIKTQFVGIPNSALQEVDRGARREFCDWELLPRLRQGGFGTALPELQSMREWTYMLAYRARVETANLQFEKAAHSIQTMFAIGRHTAEGPTMINSLIGMSSASSALERIEELIQQPDSPNMYWALAALPRPLIDIRKGLESERIAFDVHFGGVKDIETRRLTQVELDNLMGVCCGGYSPILGPDSVSFHNKLELVGKVVQLFPIARKALIDQGRKAEEIDALPMFQVVLTHNYQQFRRVLDDMWKWTYVPYWEGNEARKQVEAESRSVTMFPFGMVIHAAGRTYFASIRPDRKVAALRCIEAVRMHVAETGKVPASFDEIKIVPIPIDPITGKQFQYKAVGDLITIYGPPPPGMNAQIEGNVVHYEITIKR